ELAAAERVQPPSMTRLAGHLEEQGLVTRTAHPSDGRQVLLAASPAGAALLREDRRRREAWLARQLAGLDAEDRAVLQQATVVLDRLAAS
ncbi:MAG: transcriptional regulator, MarR family, partial [Frankiales bacterium]|nr:transcriptional regulator, MarR family [Frankiales bacterium]